MDQAQNSVVINGIAKSISMGCSLRQVLESLDVATKGVAVEVNRKLVSHDQFDVFQIQDGDQIEIVSFVGGG